jgi:hypothetical protein
LGALGFAGSFIVPKLARPAASAGAHDESVPVMTGAGESVGSAAEVTATT